MDFVSFKTVSAVAAIVLALLLEQAAVAEPMKCSGEEQTCRTACTKAARGAVSACLTRCGASKSYCLKTGCWTTNGVQRYCGLLKQ
ncbi:MAG: hypothetical protein K9G60_06775 [Pseudolabrys sp.]|nr:hypothetical protein [Pseudolabrys sp.]